MNFGQAIHPLLDREGGYVNHPSDRGGATNYGITQTVFSEWLSAREAAPRDVRSLYKSEASDIYFERYWRPAMCEQLPDAVREIHLDAAVNHGVNRAAKLLQTACGAEPDGVIGSATLAAAGAMSPDLLFARHLSARYRFYGDIIRRDRSQLVFIVGWMSRLTHFA